MSSTTEVTIRLSGLFGGLALMAIWEVLAPRRVPKVRRARRWMSNLGLLVFNTVAVRLLIPLTAVELAVMAERNGWGALHRWSLPPAWEIPLAVIALDLVIYLQHVLFHAVPAFWRLHRVHHADLEFDVTTGLRFHTIEILLSLGLKLAAILALGPSPWAVLIFEVLLNATSMFNHSNVRIPLGCDRMLRWLVVTPDMHRVHHSIQRREADSNFGFNLPWWDYLLGTYRPQPAEDYETMPIGVAELRDERLCCRLPAMLWLPLRSSRASPDGNDR
ncbi:MAG: sterol desaturase family protein [Planctomycetaceae bacterium]|nr:sterol desaturase family protein [Planctomycetaceae bacterium]